MTGRDIGGCFPKGSELPQARNLQQQSGDVRLCPPCCVPPAGGLRAQRQRSQPASNRRREKQPWTAAEPRLGAENESLPTVMFGRLSGGTAQLIAELPMKGLQPSGVGLWGPEALRGNPLLCNPPAAVCSVHTHGRAARGGEGSKCFSKGSPTCKEGDSCSPFIHDIIMTGLPMPVC